MRKREIHHSYIDGARQGATHVSRAPGGYIEIDNVLSMKDCWVRWPNGMREFIPWSDGLSVEQLRYHIRRVRLLRTNIPWKLNVLFFFAMFVCACLQAISFNRAVTQVIPKNCNETYYSHPGALFPEPVRPLYNDLFGLYNMSDHNKWYLGNWALIPARKAFCPVTIDLTAELYDVRSGEAATDDYAPSQVGIIKYCFRHDHDGGYDTLAFGNIDNANEENYGNSDSNLRNAWDSFLSARNMMMASIIFCFLATYVAWPTCLAPGYTQTLESHFFRKDKLYHHFKGTTVMSNESVMNKIHEEESAEHEHDVEMAAMNKKKKKKRMTIADTIMEEKNSRKSDHDSDAAAAGGGENSLDNHVSMKEEEDETVFKPDLSSTLQRASHSIANAFRMSVGVNNHAIEEGSDEDDDADIDHNLPRGAGSAKYLGWNDNTSAGITDREERYLYEDHYSNLMNRANTAHSLAALFLSLSTPLTLAAFSTFLSSPFTVPANYKAMFPTCDIEVRVMNAEFNTEQGMYMLVLTVAFMVMINAWHLAMHLWLHLPAGKVHEVFEMPDLKHYGAHYTKADQALFRKKDRDQKREQQRRVTRWAAKDHSYHELVSEKARLPPEPEWLCPDEWAALGQQPELEQSFLQPSEDCTLKQYY